MVFFVYYIHRTFNLSCFKLRKGIKFNKCYTINCLVYYLAFFCLYTLKALKAFNKCLDKKVLR